MATGNQHASALEEGREVKRITQVGRRPPSATRLRLREALAPYAFIGFSAVFLLVILGYPFVAGFGISMTDASLSDARSTAWVGIDNYKAIFADGRVWATLGRTVVYAIGSVGGTLLFAMSAAVLMNSLLTKWLGGIVRSLVVIPWAMPMVAAALALGWIFQYRYGIATYIAGLLGVEGVGWFTDPNLAMPLLIVATVWKIAPLSTVVILAALQSVPEERKEAALVDGADAAYVLKTVTIPHIRPTLAILTVLITVWSFRRFEIIWLLTGGGPLQRTNTLVVDVYREAFMHGSLGRGAALGIVGVFLSLIVAGVYLVLTRRLERSEEV